MRWNYKKYETMTESWNVSMEEKLYIINLIIGYKVKEEIRKK